MDRRQITILLAILSLATILRFYRLSEIPPSLEWDEVATGYDAYSILKTGRDQFGEFLPLTLRSLDDYKPPLYTYLTVGSIAVFGWNDFAVRFPAASLGVLAVITTYGLTRKLMRSQKNALLASLFLAISPWHMNFSRLALETNSTVFFTTGAAWAFLAGLNRGRWLALAAILFGLDLFLYHNARVFVPPLSLILLLLYWSQVWRQRSWALIASVITITFVIGLVPIVASLAGQMRFHGTSIFTTATPLDLAEAKENYIRWRTIDNAEGRSLYGKLFHNQYVFYGLRIFKNYLSHFDPNFLVFTNDYPRHHMPEMGILYFIDLLFLLAGGYFLVSYKDKKVVILLLAWVFLAPLPAAVTRDAPHALRSEIVLPVYQIIIAMGILGLSTLMRTKSRRLLFSGFVIIGYFLVVSFFLHKFLFFFARETSEYWMYGRREAALFTESVKSKYERIIVSTELDQPHVFWLYYLKYDPVKYLQTGGTYSGGWAEFRNHFDKYEFRRVNYGEMRDDHTLFVGLPKEFPKHAVPLKKIYYLNGKEALWIVEG